ncbi:unnamed protein product [Pocillopora meandrina]|uniref:Uncharacterized protein n=1 Tax=Pocillopora meandrina TaxID=46732 RepID=A0AAU9WA16_9CNID|nr:unnamed protein product [Pocillopora meandrina]
MLLFTEHGDFIKVISQHLIDPCSVSVRDDGHMIVCDWDDKSVKVLTPDGTGLVQSFKEPRSFRKPVLAVYHENKFFVSFVSFNYINVFSNEGLYLYDISKEALCARKLFFTKNFTIDAFNNLIVCDNNNNRRFQVLKKEAECPLCLETVKDPKTLPCLHSFCLRCIDKHAGYAKRKLETTIKCPVCQACFQIPEGDTFGNLPTSFHLNRLVDLLALRNDSEEAQRCSSCEENNTATCYCFVCQNFLCKDCFDSHQRLKATRGHRNVLIDNLQAQDVEELMHRPAMYEKKYHENEPLDYYCQDCSVCICHKCSIVSHNRHTLVDLQEAAEEQKMQMTQVFAKVKEKLVIVESKISKQTELMTKSEEEICAAEENVTKTVQEIIRIAKEHETALKTKLVEIKATQRRNYAAKIGNVQLLAAQLIKSSVEYGEGIVQRSIGPEILQAGHAVLGRCEELLTTQDIEI